MRIKSSFFYTLFFIILCIVGFILRLLTLDVPFYDDSAAGAIAQKYHDVLYSNFALAPHGPTNYLFFVIGGKLFGITTVGTHLTLFLLSIFYLILLYFFIQKMFGVKIACYTVLLNLFSFYALYNIFIIETDGIIQSVFSVLVFFPLYFFLHPKEPVDISVYCKTTNKKWWLLISILSFVFLVSMKHRTGLLIIPIFLYLLYTSKDLKKSIFYSAIYLFSGLVVLLLSIASLYWVYGREMATVLLSIISTHNAVQPSIIDKILHPSIFLTSLIGLSPLLIFLPFLTLKKWKKQYVLFYCWLILVPIYIILIPYNYPYFKYLAGFLLPPITVLSAAALTQEKIKKSVSVWITLCTIPVSLFFILINNTIPTDYWFFLEAMGPVVKVWQPFIYVLFPLSFFLFLYLLFKKYSQHSLLRTCVLSIFLVLTFSFNIMMITDNTVDRTHSLLIKDVQDYASDHRGKLGTVYSWNEDIAFYVGNIGYYVPGEDEPNFWEGVYNNSLIRTYDRSLGLGQHGYIDLNAPFDKLKLVILQKGGTAFLLNYPYKYVVAASSDVQQKIAFFDMYCIREKQSTYKTGELLIYHCLSQK